MSNETKRLWILGAADPEMAAIEELLTEAGEQFVFAGLSGQRVHPGNMYKAEQVLTFPLELTPVVPELVEWVPDAGRPIITVECAVSEVTPSHAIDHHRAGDAGFGAPPEDFFTASSIGQVIAHLNKENVQVFPDGPLTCTESIRVGEVKYAEVGEVVEGCLETYDAWAAVGSDPTRYDKYDRPFCDVIPSKFLMVAAADHCLGAAYKGECPGVDPKKLAEFRAQQRAEFQGRSVEDITNATNVAKMLLQAKLNSEHDFNERMAWEGCSRRDMSEFIIDVRGVHIDELPEAACQIGVAYLAGPLNCPDGRKKVVMGGCTTPKQINKFLAGEIAPELVDRYGDPARGFAGGYMPVGE